MLTLKLRYGGTWSKQSTDRINEDLNLVCDCSRCCVNVRGYIFQTFLLQMLHLIIQWQQLQILQKENFLSCCSPWHAASYLSLSLLQKHTLKRFNLFIQNLQKKFQLFLLNLHRILQLTVILQLSKKELSIVNNYLPQSPEQCHHWGQMYYKKVENIPSWCNGRSLQGCNCRIISLTFHLT